MAELPQSSELQGWYREAERAVVSKDYRRAHELCLRILSHDAQFAQAFFLLSVIAAEHCNYRKAIELMQRAIQLDARQADFHAHVGRCLIALNRPGAAKESAIQALKLTPASALTLDTIGVVLTRAGAYAEAIDPLQRAVALAPNRAAYHYNLGAALQFMGEFDAAARSYRAALAVDETYHRAWSALTSVTSLQPRECERLHAMLEQPLEADAELHICHALAKQSEDAGEYAASFSLLQRGKRRKRATLKYSIEDDAALFGAVRKTATPSFLHAASTGCSSREPIFIVGMPRTGTTLVERILSSHSSVFSAGELSDFSLAVKRAARTPSNLVLDPPTMTAVEHLDFASVGRAYIESTRPRTGHTPHFIDKMPLNFLYVGLIHRALPNAKIIVVRRNALDTCLSNYRQLFATSFPYYNYAYELLDVGQYYLMFDDLMRYWGTHLRSNYHEVSYESVVSDTEREARRLVDFCELPWETACLDFHQNSAPVATASSVQVRQPIYKSSVERWRKYEYELAPLRELLERRERSSAPE